MLIKICSSLKRKQFYEGGDSNTFTEFRCIKYFYMLPSKIKLEDKPNRRIKQQFIKRDKHFLGLKSRVTFFYYEFNLCHSNTNNRIVGSCLQHALKLICLLMVSVVEIRTQLNFIIDIGL